VDGFIDKLADFLRSVLGDGDAASRGASGADGSPRHARYADPDLQEAWEELDDYMRTGTEKERPRPGKDDGPRTPKPADESLRHDYANLEVPFGSDIETVRASYKRLIMRYHPDKQAGDPEKQRVALEITKKINESFERIRRRQQ
jgi:DnaJ-domain-containing protein 1